MFSINLSGGGVLPTKGVREIELKKYLLAVRPWSFSITAISVVVGTLLAAALAGQFNLWLFLLVLVAMIVVHAATNLINDYFDVQEGVDKPGAPTTQYRPHPVLTGEMRPAQALQISLLLYAIALGIGILLMSIRGWEILALAIVGGLASFLYTGGPLKYKYIALGEVSVFLMWGPLMLLGSYFVQTRGWEHAPQVLLISLPIGLWVSLVLLANNLKDIEYDRSVGIKTIAILMGRSATLNLYSILLVAIYILFMVFAVLGTLPIYSAAVILTSPLAFKLIQSLRDADEIPPDADPRTAQLATQTGLLLVISLLIALVVGWAL